MLVKEWIRESRDIRKQDVRETTYTSAVVNHEKLFQIQTYGLDGSAGSAKQTIQFNKEQAAELVEILKREFDL